MPISNVAFAAFSLLFESAEITNFAPEEKSKYEKDMTTERDIRNYISYARLEGREEGRQEGEAASRREIAKALLEKGIDKAIIASCTGLSEDEIEKL